MSRHLGITSALAALLVVWLAAAPARAAAPAGGSGVGHRLALVVGAGDYDDAAAWPRLPNARGDAEALGSELRSRYGFRVTSLTDPDALTFKKTLAQLAAQSEEDDDLVVFVAGHGFFDDDDHAGYLVFKEASRDCAAGCYPFDNLKRALYDARARHILVVLDACYGGAFDLSTAFVGEATRGPSPGDARQALADYARAPSRLMLASVGTRPTSDGPPGRHSPFMEALLGALARPGPSGVVSLDRLVLALQEGSGGTAPLAITRPSAFPAARPHHPNGTFLFIEDVDFCAATTAVVEAEPGFEDLRLEARATHDWGSAWAARWVPPGAGSCDVWRWAIDGRSQVRCDLGAYGAEAAAAKAAAAFGQVQACLSEPGWAPDTSERTLGDERVVDRRVAHAGSGRSVTVTTACREGCTVTLVFE